MKSLKKLFRTGSRQERWKLQLTEEERWELLEPNSARRVGLRVIKMEGFYDAWEKNPDVWLERARKCIKHRTLDENHHYLQYAIYALDRFVTYSPDKNSQMVQQAAELIPELVEDWRSWKSVLTSGAAEIVLDSRFLDYERQKQLLRLQKLGSYDDVIQICDSAEGILSEVEALSLKIRSLISTGRLNEAAECCNKIIDAQPADTYYIFNVGNTYLGELSRFQEAIETYDRVIAREEAEPGERKYLAKALHNKAVAHLGVRGVDEAVKCLERCITVADEEEVLTSANDILDWLKGRTKADGPKKALRIMH